MPNFVLSKAKNIIINRNQFFTKRQKPIFTTSLFTKHSRYKLHGMSSNPTGIVVLDGYTLNPGDLDWSPLSTLGSVAVYDHSTPKEMAERAQDAQIILVNKAVVDSALLHNLPNLACICVTATGYNNVDVIAARKRNIPVCNVVGYGSNSVAQHVFAFILAFSNHLYEHSQSVKEGKWAQCRDFSYTIHPILGLNGRTLGIYGFGKIGQQVFQIGKAFGMNIIATHKHPKRDARPGISFVDLPTLFANSDFITLHAPLTPQNQGIVNLKLLKLMKSTAYLINTGRGGLINEDDLKTALETNCLAGAGLDVLNQEPPPREHPLYNLDQCLITPHQAWASRSARQTLLDESILNVKYFLSGHPRNVVNE